MKKRYRGLLLAAMFALFLCGCGGSDSGAYDRGLAAMESGDYETAITEFQAAADDDGRESEAYRCLGIIYLRQGNADTAITFLNMSLDKMQYKNEDFTEDVKYYLAQAELKAGDTVGAEALYQELEEGKTPVQACLLEGKLQLENGDTEAAETAFRSAVENDPSAENYIRIYEYYRDANLEADGADYLQEALQNQDEEEEENTYAKGLIYYYLGEYSKAQEILTAAADQNDTDAILLLGSIYLDNDDIGNATDLFQRCLEQGSESGAVYNGLARCSMAGGDYDAALDYINQGLAVADEEEEESLLFNEVLIYEKKQDVDTAKQKLQYFLEKYPDNEEAQREMTFLESR